MSDLMDALLALFGLDLSQPITNLAEFLPVFLKFILATFCVTTIIRGVFASFNEWGSKLL